MKGFDLNKRNIFLILLVLLLSVKGSPVTFSHQKSVLLSQDQELLVDPGSFFITKSGDIYIVDPKSSNIKIYNSKGKLIKIFSKKGLGPNEFIKPFFSDYKNGLIAIEDFGRNMYFVYQADANNTLKIAKKCANHNMSSDFKFIDNRSLLIAGDKIGKDGKWNSIYIYNFEENTYEYIIPTEVIYGYDSYREYRSAIMNSLSYIQTDCYCDLNDEFFFVVMNANLRIVRIDRKKGDYFIFGEKTRNYIKPYENGMIRKAYLERNRKKIVGYMNEMSNIRDLFVLNSGKLGLIYIGPKENSAELSVFLQLYNGQGKLINESNLLNSDASDLFDILYYFEKDKDLLHILEPEMSEDFEQNFLIHKIKIVE
ncbi:MAG: hypothetical protein ABFR36_05490 [Acidobacteriota bacterium]